MNADDIFDKSDGKSFWNELGGYFGVGFVGGLSNNIPVLGMFASGTIISGGNSYLRGNSPEEIEKDAIGGFFTAGFGSLVKFGLKGPIDRITKGITNDLVRNITKETVLNGISTFSASLLVGKTIYNIQDDKQLYREALINTGISIGFSVGTGIIETYNSRNTPNPKDTYRENYYGNIAEPDLPSVYSPLDANNLNISFKIDHFDNQLLNSMKEMWLKEYWRNQFLNIRTSINREIPYPTKYRY